MCAILFPAICRYKWMRIFDTTCEAKSAHLLKQAIIKCKITCLPINKSLGHQIKLSFTCVTAISILLPGQESRGWHNPMPIRSFWSWGTTFLLTLQAKLMWRNTMCVQMRVEKKSISPALCAPQCKSISSEDRLLWQIQSGSDRNNSRFL